jgi:hypothetical protein
MRAESAMAKKVASMKAADVRRPIEEDRVSETIVLTTTRL